MNVLGDLVARARRSDVPALRTPVTERPYDYRRFCTTAWKVGNFLRHLGVREGVTVGVADGKGPEPVLTLFGTALLGASVRFDPPREADVRALVAPVERVDEYDLPPGGQRVGYGGVPDDPRVAQFERDVWSENPTEPPDAVEADQPVLWTAEGHITHTELLDAAQSVVKRWNLTTDDTVAVRAPLHRPGTVVAGVVAPILAGGVVLFPDEDDCGDYAVADGDAPEDRVVSPAAVEL